MKLTSILIVATALTAFSVPATLALDIGIGVAAGVSADASSGQSSNAEAGGSVDASASATAGANGEVADVTGSKLGADSSGTTSSGEHSLAAAGSTAAALQTVIRLIEASTWTKQSLSNVTDVKASIFDVDVWIDAEGKAALASTVTAHARKIAALQTAVAANAELKAALEANGSDASAVIAVGIAADGSLAVFTR